MSIENPEAYAKSQPDWANIFPYKPPANPRWRLSDMDGFGERRGRFLGVEWKSPGVPLTFENGQGKSLLDLASETNWSVIVLWGTAPDGPVVSYQRLGKDPAPVPVTGREHVDAYQAWYEWADTHPAGDTPTPLPDAGVRSSFLAALTGLPFVVPRPLDKALTVMAQNPSDANITAVLQLLAV